MSVYLHYGQDDLNKQYDQGSLVTDPSPWLAPVRILSSNVASVTSERDVLNYQENVAYGDHPDELLDIYLPQGTGPWPLVIYCHGGAWRALGKLFAREIHS